MITWDEIYNWSAEEMREACRDPKKRMEVNSAINKHKKIPKKIYVIGSLRGRKKVMAFANELRKQNFDVFDDWVSPGEFADIHLWKYYQQRGFTYEQMIQSHAARNNYLFDRKHLDEADIVILYGKGGKSAHLELGYSAAKKPSFLFLEKAPSRPDIMYAFLYDSGGGIFFDRTKLFEALKKI